MPVSTVCASRGRSSAQGGAQPGEGHPGASERGVWHIQGGSTGWRRQWQRAASEAGDGPGDGEGDLHRGETVWGNRREDDGDQRLMIG